MASILIICMIMSLDMKNIRLNQIREREAKALAKGLMWAFK